MKKIGHIVFKTVSIACKFMTCRHAKQFEVGAVASVLKSFWYLGRKRDHFVDKQKLI